MKLVVDIKEISVSQAFTDTLIPQAWYRSIAFGFREMVR